MPLEMNTLRSAFGWWSYLIRTRNNTCKLWWKRAGCLLQTLLHFHFKWQVLCTINQKTMLRGSTLSLTKAFKEWEHGCPFPFLLSWHNLSRCLTQAEIHKRVFSLTWPLLPFPLGKLSWQLSVPFHLWFSLLGTLGTAQLSLDSRFLQIRLCWNIWWSHVQKAKALWWLLFFLRFMLRRKEGVWGELGRERVSWLWFIILLNEMGSVTLPFRSRGCWLLTACTSSSVGAAAVLTDGRNSMWKVKSLSQNAPLWYRSCVWLSFTLWSHFALRTLLLNSASCTAGQRLSLLTSMSENEQTQNFSRCYVGQLSGILTIHAWIIPLAQRSKHFCQKLLNQFSLLLHQKVSLKHTQMSVFTHNHW